MKYIHFHFYDKDRLLNKAIEKKTFGRWSHVSVQVGADVYEAIGGRLFGQNGVLKSTNKHDYHRGKHKSKVTQTVTIPIKNAKSVVSHLESLVGTKYGYLGVIRFILPFIKDKYKGRYCSKLAAEAYTLATGQKLAQKEVSVNALYDVVIAKSLP